MNDKGGAPEQPGTLTNTELSGRLVVLPGNVSSRIHSSRMPLDGGDREAAVRLENGQEVPIPLALLERREDGAFFLTYRLDEPKAGQHRVESNGDLVVPVN